MVSVTVYCDNKGVITQIMSHATVTSLFPNQSIKDDFDVFHKIASILAAVPNVAFKFWHIKGHQDCKRNPKQLHFCKTQYWVQSVVAWTEYIT